MYRRCLLGAALLMVFRAMYSHHLLPAHGLNDHALVSLCPSIPTPSLNSGSASQLGHPSSAHSPPTCVRTRLSTKRASSASQSPFLALRYASIDPRCYAICERIVRLIVSSVFHMPTMHLSLIAAYNCYTPSFRRLSSSGSTPFTDRNNGSENGVCRRVCTCRFRVLRIFFLCAVALSLSLVWSAY